MTKTLAAMLNDKTINPMMMSVELSIDMPTIVKYPVLAL